MWTFPLLISLIVCGLVRVRVSEQECAWTLVYVCMWVSEQKCVCMHVCVSVCVHACVNVCECVSLWGKDSWPFLFYTVTGVPLWRLPRGLIGNATASTGRPLSQSRKMAGPPFSNAFLPLSFQNIRTAGYTVGRPIHTNSHQGLQRTRQRNYYWCGHCTAVGHVYTLQQSTQRTGF